MKIGILTFHRAWNYGAVLQAYALQHFFYNNGINAEIIDYKIPYFNRKYRIYFNLELFIRSLLKFNIKYAYFLIQSFFDSFKKKKNFLDFVNNYLLLSIPFDGKNLPSDYDYYIVGSDQVWGLHCTNGYDPIFWGNFHRINQSKLIGYAISSNGDFFSKLPQDLIINNLHNFDKLSFRESSIRDKIRVICGEKYDVCVDPTLLLPPSSWNSLITHSWSKNKYCAIYFIRENNVVKKNIYKKIYNFALLQGIEVIDLSKMTYSVCDFVSIIKYAECVFTTSFHATVFSIIFGVPFSTIVLEDGHDGRCNNLLIDLGLSTHLLKLNEDIVFPLSFDKEMVHKVLNNYVQSSKSFLLQNVGERIIG